MDSIGALSRSRYRERRLNKPVITDDVTASTVIVCLRVASACRYLDTPAPNISLPTLLTPTLRENFLAKIFNISGCTSVPHRLSVSCFHLQMGATRSWWIGPKCRFFANFIVITCWEKFHIPHNTIVSTYH